jgi:hypothetical protein
MKKALFGTKPLENLIRRNSIVSIAHNIILSIYHFNRSVKTAENC